MAARLPAMLKDAALTALVAAVLGLFIVGFRTRDTESAKVDLQLGGQQGTVSVTKGNVMHILAQHLQLLNDWQDSPPQQDSGGKMDPKYQTVLVRNDVEVATIAITDEDVKFERIELTPLEEERDESRERQLGLIEPERRPERISEAPASGELDELEGEGDMGGDEEEGS